MGLIYADITAAVNNAIGMSTVLTLDAVFSINTFLSSVSRI